MVFIEGFGAIAHDFEIAIRELLHRSTRVRIGRTDVVDASRHRRTFASLSCFAAFALASVGPASAAPPNASELSVWSRVDPRVLHRLATVVSADASGAVGNNRARFLQVGLQNQSSWIAPEALVERDPKELARAFDIIEYGFAHERATGDFEWHAGDSGTAVTPLSRAGSAAFFLADVGQTISLVRQSDWFEQSNETVDLRARETALVPKLRLAVRWLASQRSVLDTDRAAVNRTFVYAVAYALPGRLTDVASARDAGAYFARNALDRQSSDGTFPESGGFDSSYQAVSLYLAQVLYLETDFDGHLHDDLWKSIARANDRERDAIADDGTVSTLRNSRIGGRGEKLFGRTKTVDGRAATLGLLFYALLSDDETLRSHAMSVAHRYHVDGT